MLEKVAYTDLVVKEYNQVLYSKQNVKYDDMFFFL